MKATWVRLLAWSEIVGGGLIIVAYLATMVVYHIAPRGWQAPVALLFGLTGVVAGWALQRGHLLPSLALQLLQVVNVGAAFRYVAFTGTMAGIVVGERGVFTDWEAGGAFCIAPHAATGQLDAVGFSVGGQLGAGSTASGAWTIAVNLVALYFVVRLATAMRAQRVQSVAMDAAAQAT